MKSCIQFLILSLLPAMLKAQTATPDPAGVLSSLSVARFLGSGTQSIEAMTSDADGNVYVAGTTSSINFPVKDATQPAIGDAVLMRSQDGGVSWQKVPIPLLSLVTITSHPSDPQTLFAGTSDGIYKTTDGGQTWRDVYTWVNPAHDDLINITFDPADLRNVYFYATLDYYSESGSPVHLFGTSSDGGQSWKQIGVPTIQPYILIGAPALWVDPNGSGTVALGAWLSRDHGNTWTAMSPLPGETPPFGFIFTVPSPHHTGWIYAEGDGGYLYLSKDWGATWTEQPSPLAPSCPCSAVLSDLRFDPDLSDTLWADDLSGVVYTSQDAGANWSVVATQWYVAEGTRLALLSRSCSGGSLLGISDDASVVASLDYGPNWLPERLTNIVDLDAGPGCAVYAVRTVASDAFVAKLAPGGSVLWATFLGGSDLDASVAIALDAQGDIYVAGVTASPDFPTTAPRLGTQGTSNAFATKFDSDGHLVYSVVIGGESRDTVTGLAVGAQGEAHLAGWTISSSFPATPGAFATGPGSNNGFAVKLGPDGTIMYASYLPGFAPNNPPPPGPSLRSYPPKTVAVTVEASGSALFGGPTGVLSRMTSDGSGFVTVSSQPGPILVMDTDAQGSLYVAGQIIGQQVLGGALLCNYGTQGNAFLTKLQPDTLQQSFQAWLGNCPTWPSALKISPTGETTLSLWTNNGSLPLLDPLLLSSGCYTFDAAPAVARLSSDGSGLLFSSYLDTCPQGPAIALAPDGSTYASVTSYYWAPGGGGVAVLQIPAALPDAPAVTGAFNAFSGSLASAAPGMLLTITGGSLASESIDLGIDDPNPLPMELELIQVLFDRTPAQILQVAPNYVICVVPPMPPGKTFVGVEVVKESQVARHLNSVVPVGPRRLRQTAALTLTLPVHSNVGLLTSAFPALPPLGVVDGNIRNVDGTVNDAQHPAAPGSIVTLYATGVSQSGYITLYWDPSEPRCFDFLCQPTPSTSGNARLMAGFIEAIYAIDYEIPAQAASGRHVISTEAWPVTHAIAVYVQ